jgi:hypothetical protein
MLTLGLGDGDIEAEGLGTALGLVTGLGDTIPLLIAALSEITVEGFINADKD